MLVITSILDGILRQGGRSCVILCCPSHRQSVGIVWAIEDGPDFFLLLILRNPVILLLPAHAATDHVRSGIGRFFGFDLGGVFSIVTPCCAAYTANS